MTLVVLAAGIGSRFGGIKQLTPLTDENEYILDFTVYDALRAGFDKIIFIIRHDIEELFEERIGRRLRISGVKFTYAYQENKLPDGYIFPRERTKPFGTVHAVLSIGGIDEPFAVVNADDFYGYEPLKLITKHLSAMNNEWYSVGYRLKNTLSKNGTVSRGVCKVDKNHYLIGIDECKKIASYGNKVFNTNSDGSVTPLNFDDLVSMTCFGFTPDFYEKLNGLFTAFLQENQKDFTSCEYILSEALKQMLSSGAKVKVLDTDTEWCGVTYKEDSEHFRNFIRALKEHGNYPTHLW